jgi:oligopeptide/dipeptide ABC transporter ATP-binding protein
MMRENSATDDIATPLVDVRKLKKWFPVRKGLFSATLGHIRAVDGVTFTIHRGETLGLVGESGCGKSTLGRLILHLLPPTDGVVYMDGMDVTRIPGRELKRFRQRAQLVFQDPYSSLNPRMTVGTALREVLLVHNVAPRSEITDRVASLLRMVGLNDFHARRYPHEFSSGQRQRIGIARALAVHPEFVVCDEPVSALDVSIQAQILNLLADLRAQLQLTYLFISHNLTVVQHVSDRIAIMYLGRIVEIGPTDDVMHNPLHPYTQLLLASVPVADPDTPRKGVVLDRETPDPLRLPTGCTFHPRCRFATDECRIITPELALHTGERLVSCLLYEACRTRPMPSSGSAAPVEEQA